MAVQQEEADICLSVIIPAFNAEKSIEKCLRSVINQNISGMEIIIVNDGSTDNTSQIISLFASTHKEIHVHTTANNGVAYARNIGLMMVKGKYVTFVDSDDYLEEDAYNSMLHEMEKYHADIVEGVCRKEKKNGALLCNCVLRKQVINGKYNCAEHFLRQTNCCNYMCNKIYRKELFHNKRFPKLQYSEDYYMNTLLHKNAYCKVVLNKLVYHYVIHDESACGKEFDLRRIDIVKAGVMTADLLKDRHLKVYPCMYTCDYCIQIAKTIYVQNNNKLFRQFILLSMKDYLHMLKEISPRHFKDDNKYYNYWIYVLFAFFPKGVIKLLI